MLKSLFIVNYALIDEIHLEFDKGLNIITGETGAGKSILIGALSLVLGSRADSSHILNKSTKTIVEAIFVDYDKEIQGILEEEDLDIEEELFLRRELSVSGKSRAFINDTPVNLITLQRLASKLVDLNRQHEIRDIIDRDFHYKMIDALASNSTQVDVYRKEYNLLRKKQIALKELQEKIRADIKEKEFIQFQYDELEVLDIKPGEVAVLEEQVNLSKRAEEISQALRFSMDAMTNDEGSIDNKLITLVQQWSALAEINGTYKEIYDRICSIQEEIRDLTSLVGSQNDGTEVSSGQIEEREERLDQINKLLFKHQLNDESELMQLMVDLSNALLDSATDEKKADKLVEEISILEAQLRKKAEILSKKRKSVFSDLESRVNNHLSALSMVHARIRVEWGENEELTLYGIDLIEIKFSPNQGSDFASIKKVASGGESSRLMLCMKTTVADAIDLPTMIFDEIDTGVSGDVAGKMGSMLNGLSEKHQIIVITHLPQVAAKGETHFFVYKEIEEGKTLSKMQRLGSESRVVEIAKMLSGDPPSDAAMANAKDLLK